MSLLCTSKIKIRIECFCFEMVSMKYIKQGNNRTSPRRADQKNRAIVRCSTTSVASHRMAFQHLTTHHPRIQNKCFYSMCMLPSFCWDYRFSFGAVHKLRNAVGRGGVRESGRLFSLPGHLA